MAANGPLPDRRGHAYPWGIALDDFQVGKLLRVAGAWQPASNLQRMTLLLACSPLVPLAPGAEVGSPPIAPHCPSPCMQALQPDARVVNLETAVTTHPQPWPSKGINYRMHPGVCVGGSGGQGLGRGAAYRGSACPIAM